MLTGIQEGYGPAHEFYHDGQYHGVPVSARAAEIDAGNKADLS
jgi:hypothetical protein